MENASNLLPIGATLQRGKYRVDRQLASGGFGNTYVVTDVQFEETYAMKEFYLKGVNERDDDSRSVSVSNAENTPEFVAQKEKFKKEALRLRRLNNDHVVRVYDLFDENGTTYYVMDFLEGESLSARMKKAGHPFSEEEVTDYIRQVLEALHCVHQENIWHLDLKPGNIMTDGQGRAVLIDFGASKQFHDSDGRSLSTSTGLCYTPGFAPTEQIESNTSRMGPWTDLYALGATAYNLLTMKTPPSVSDIQDGEGFEFPEDASPEMQRMIRWMMDPNRKRRPQSVTDVWLFMERHMGLAAPDQPSGPILGSTDTVRAQASPVHQASEPAYAYQEEEKPKRSLLPWIVVGVAGVAAVVLMLIVGFYLLKPSPRNEIADAYDQPTEVPIATADPASTATEPEEEPAAGVAAPAEDYAPAERPETEKKTEKRRPEETVDIDRISKRSEPAEEEAPVISKKEEPKEEADDSKVYEVVEQMPDFPGGQSALRNYLSQNLRYPPIAEENGIQGRVVCQFIVERDGSVSSVHVVRSVDPSLDKEAMRVINSMPRWVPGKQNGKAIRVKYTLPITFTL
ncbi:MAG: TonB family protein [Prevotella sp.]|nr:TonB family protein [Prevotella sp.]